MFPMQRQSQGRVMVLGSAPSLATRHERLSYKLKGWGKIPDAKPAPPVTFNYKI